MRLDPPSAVRNPVSLIGAAITTTMALVFLALIALELGGRLRNPPVTATNALLLGYLYRPYTGQAGFVRLTYLW